MLPSADARLLMKLGVVEITTLIELEMGWNRLVILYSLSYCTVGLFVKVSLYNFINIHIVSRKTTFAKNL